jgi:peptidase E
MELFLVGALRHKYLQEYGAQLQEFLTSFKHKDENGLLRYILYIPYGYKDYDCYFQATQRFFTTIGWANSLISIHEYEKYNFKSPKEMLLNLSGIATILLDCHPEEGNIFRLLTKLQEEELMEPMRNKIFNGVRLIAGDESMLLACPSIKTTNQTAIIMPKDFNGLSLLDFQLTTQNNSTIYHQENDLPVIQFSESNWLIVVNNQATLHGDGYAFVYQKGKARSMALPGRQLIY